MSADQNRSNDRVTVWQDAKGEWRWTRRARNGRIISVSGEGYVDKQYTLDMANDLNPDVRVRFADE